MKQLLLTIKEILEVVLIAVVTVVIIRHFVVQPFLVSGASMEPNFSDGNYLLIDEITYRFREPQRREAVVFRYPLDRKVFFIKRLVGVPGDHVVIKNGKVTVNGELVDGSSTSGSVNVKLKDNEYYVLGDNRSQSFDSRNWGPITRKDIIGLVRLRILPLNKISAFNY
jgi:signal peptidase I